MDLSSLVLSEAGQKENTSTKTEAEFCFTCSIKGLFGLKEIESISQHLEQSKTEKNNSSKAFREKLMKRVAGQVEAKLFQAQVLKNCVFREI